MTDPVKIFLHSSAILFADTIEDVSELMGPTALKRDLGINKRQSRQKPLAPIGDNQFESLSCESSSVQIRQEDLPGGLRLGSSHPEVNHLFLAFRGDSQDYQDEALGPLPFRSCV